MKNKNVLILTAAIGGMIALNSCNTSKTVAEANDQKEVILPFAGSEYRSDKDNFCAVSSGQSPDLPTSQKIAMQNAQAKLAGEIKAVLSSAAKQYTNQASIGNKQDYENKFEEQIWTFVDQTLYNVRVLGEKAYEGKKDARFTDWVAIQESKADILAGLSSRINNSDRLRLDYDEKKFGEDVDKQMQKMQEEQSK